MRYQNRQNSRFHGLFELVHTLRWAWVLPPLFVSFTNFSKFFLLDLARMNKSDLILFFLNPPSGNDLTYFTTFHFKNRGKNDDIHGRNELQTDEVRVKKCLTIFTTVKLASNSYFQL